MRKSSVFVLGGLVFAGAVALGAGCTVNSQSKTTNNNNDGGGGAGASGGGTTTTGTGGYGQGGGYGGAGVGGAEPLPTSCDPNAADTACDTCMKTSCCNELEACNGDANCVAAYGEFNKCLFPDGQNWSGYDSNYCTAAADPDNTKKLAPVTACIYKNDKCGTEAACGEEVQATWGNFAAAFVEHYCVGCHHPNYWSPGGVKTANFTKDETWANDGTNAHDVALGGKDFPDWFDLMDYNAVVASTSSSPTSGGDGGNDLFWCGLVAPTDTVPSECAQFTWNAADAADCQNGNTANCGGKVVAGNPRFPKAARFPPVGGVAFDHFGETLHCWWTDDTDVASPGTDCQMPTDAERHMFVSWINNSNPM